MRATFSYKWESLLGMYDQGIARTPVLEPNDNTHKQNLGRNIMVFTTSQFSVQLPHLPHHPHRSVSSSAPCLLNLFLLETPENVPTPS